MPRQFFVLISTLLTCPCALAQESSPPDVIAEGRNTPVAVPPFFLLEAEVKDQPGGWAGNKEQLSSIFNAERVRLADKFEFALMKYLGSDPEKHYWISIFLAAPGYLHQNKPLPYLSLLQKQQGLSLLQERTDQEGRSFSVSLNVTAAILTAKRSPFKLSRKSTECPCGAAGCSKPASDARTT